jgi:outer membrane protein OmpA-like peptidoglycan-associated protein
MLIGRQTDWFLGAEPGHQVSQVAVRVIIQHDAATITGITLWPDLAALREAVSGTARMIDLTKTGDAGGMIAALRATIPPVQSRLIIGSAREQPRVTTALPTEPAAPAAPEGSPIAGRTVPKPPVPRQVRRRRALVAGSVMLVASAVLTAWVVVGALTSPAVRTVIRGGAGSTAGAGTPNGTAGSGTGSGRSGASGQSGRPTGQGNGQAAGGAAGQGAANGTTTNADALPPSPSATRLTVADNEVTVPSDLLFDTDSTRLRPEARAVLAGLIRDARAQHRRGQVSVSGYTDDVGTAAYNLRLSQRRAATVSAVLEKGLAGVGMTFVHHGYGMTHPVRPNTTAALRGLNRRVTVSFPSASR